VGEGGGKASMEVFFFFLSISRTIGLRCSWYKKLK
jgi:hypothetical protein